MDVREATRIALLAETMISSSAERTDLAVDELLTNCAAASLALSAARRHAAKKIAALVNARDQDGRDTSAEIARLSALTSTLDDTSKQLNRSIISLRELRNEKFSQDVHS